MKRSTHIIAALLGSLAVCGCSGDSTFFVDNGDGGTTIIVESDSGVPEASLPNKLRTVYCTASVTPSYSNVGETAPDAGVPGALSLSYTETDFDDGSVYMSSTIAGAQEGSYGSPSFLPSPTCSTNTAGNSALECQSATFIAGFTTQQAINSTFWTPAQGGSPSLTTPFKVYPVASQLVVNVNTYPLNLTTNALPTATSNGYFYYDTSGVAHTGSYQTPGMWTVSVDRGFTTFTALYVDGDLTSGQETFSSPTSTSCIISMVDAGG